ncbi:hypothetical protein ACFQZ4_28545 [Catellatospora coxensis]
MVEVPQLTADQVLERMTRTAVDKGPAGRDNDYGFGLVDPVAALTAPAASPSAAAPTAAPSVEVSLPELPGTPDNGGLSGLFTGVGLVVILLVGVALVVAGIVVFLVLRKRR